MIFKKMKQVVHMKIKKLRAVISTLLLVCLVAMLVTGMILHFMKSGSVGKLARHTLVDFHFYCSIAMTTLGVIHFFINRFMYKDEMKALLKHKSKNND